MGLKMFSTHHLETSVKQETQLKKKSHWDFSVAKVQWLKLCTLCAGGVPWFSRSHMLQLSFMLQLKILHAANETPCSQINKQNKFKNLVKTLLRH